MLLSDTPDTPHALKPLTAPADTPSITHGSATSRATETTPIIAISATTRAFITEHANDNVRDLALHAPRNIPDLDVPFALNQIAGHATARTKLPEWAAHNDIIYPPHISMEQCSSQFTAQYKASLARELTANYPHPTSLVDLTGGFGVDFSYMARSFDHATYVEQQEHLCTLAAHNMHALGLDHVTIVHDDAIDYLHAMTPATLIYLDPARRDTNGARTYAIQDCTPNVLALRDELLKKAPMIMVKLSPMLDWRKTLDDFDGHIAQLHIVASGNECKEILIIVTRDIHDHARIVCVNDNDQLVTTADTDEHPSILDTQQLADMHYVYEPNASIMKAGAFGTLQRAFPELMQIGNNSHLFVSAREIPDFPGRVFTIEQISTMNKRDLRALTQNMTHANIAVRNFPLSAPQLRKKLKLKDGGETYIFATTDANKRHILLCTRKVSTQ